MIFREGYPSWIISHLQSCCLQGWTKLELRGGLCWAPCCFLITTTAAAHHIRLTTYKKRSKGSRGARCFQLVRDAHVGITFGERIAKGNEWNTDRRLSKIFKVVDVSRAMQSMSYIIFLYQAKQNNDWLIKLNKIKIDGICCNLQLSVIDTEHIDK